MWHRLVWLVWLICIALSGMMGAQTKEYIRVNSRVIAIENIASANFSLSTSVANATVVRGGSTPITITVTPASGFTGGVSLAMDSALPGGVTAVFSPASVTVASGSVTSTLTLTADATATTGTVSISVKGTSASPVLTRTASVNLTTVLPPDFSLGGLTNLSLTAGSNSTGSPRVVTVSPANGFGSNVNFTISGLPSGVTAVFSPGTVGASPWNSTITFTATAGATLGTSTVTVTGTSTTPSLVRTTTMQLTITAQPAFTLNAPAGGSIVVGNAATYSVNLTADSGFNSGVDFSIAGMPAGVSASFSPASVSASPWASGLTLTVALTASPNTYPLTITANSPTPGINRTRSFSLTILPAQQSITGASINPPGASEVTIQSTVSDPTGAAQIVSAEFSLSTSTNSNTFQVNNACRFRVNRQAGANPFSMTIAHRDGNGSIVDTKTIGLAGTLSNGACALDMAQTSVVQSANNWTVNARVRRLEMSGVHYLRAMTTDGPGASLPQPYTFLGPSWNIPAPPTVTFSNSQGVTPPVVYSSFAVNITMSVANQGGRVG